MKEGEGTKQKKNVYIYTHRDKDNSEVTAGGKGCEGVGRCGQWAVT